MNSRQVVIGGITIQDANIYLTESFTDRMDVLNRVNLRDLFPSEAWSMYRILPQCSSILDLGCGGSNMFQVVRQIVPNAYYTGLDLNPTLVERGQEAFANTNAQFVQGDILGHLQKTDQKYDCVMGWGVTYVIPFFYDALDLVMSKDMSQFFIFDMRVTGSDSTLDDMDLSSASYGGIANPNYWHSFTEFLQIIKKWEHKLKNVEISGYEFPVGEAVRFSPDSPRPTVLSVVLESNSNTDSPEPACNWFIRVPPSLSVPDGFVFKGNAYVKDPNQ